MSAIQVSQDLGCPDVEDSRTELGDCRSSGRSSDKAIAPDDSNISRSEIYLQIKFLLLANFRDMTAPGG